MSILIKEFIMRLPLLTTLLLGLTLMAGCGKPEEEKKPTSVEKTIIESQKQALDQAKGLEQTLQQDAKAQEEAMKKQMQEIK